MKEKTNITTIIPQKTTNKQVFSGKLPSSSLRGIDLRPTTPQQVFRPLGYKQVTHIVVKVAFHREVVAAPNLLLEKHGSAGV